MDPKKTTPAACLLSELTTFLFALGAITLGAIFWTTPSMQMRALAWDGVGLTLLAAFFTDITIRLTAYFPFAISDQALGHVNRKHVAGLFAAAGTACYFGTNQFGVLAFFSLLSGAALAASALKLALLAGSDFLPHARKARLANFLCEALMWPSAILLLFGSSAGAIAFVVSFAALLWAPAKYTVGRLEINFWPFI